MSRLSRVHLATKELTEPRRSTSPLAYQYVLFKREAQAQQDRLYMRAMLQAATPIPDPEPVPAQRGLLE